MTPFTKSLLFSTFTLFLTGSIAASEPTQPFYPYFGLEFKWQNTEGKKDWNKLISKSYPGATLYVGERFAKHAGIEIGYSETTRKTRTHTFATGENFFNNGNTAGAQTKTSLKFRTAYFDLNGYYPLNKSFELIGSIGGGLIRPSVKIGTTGFRFNDAIALAATKAKIKGLIRLGAGVQFLFTDCINIRGMLRWESTSLYRVDGFYNSQQTSIHTNSLRHLFKDTYSANIGLFIKF
jgi:hypothetical protein